jgi:chromosome partitioning protein
VSRGALNSTLDIEGVLFTMFDERTNLAQQVAREVRAFFKEKVFRTTIPRNVRLGEAPSHGMPVIQYDPKSKGSEAYVAPRTRSARARRCDDDRADLVGHDESRKPNASIRSVARLHQRSVSHGQTTCTR